ncbi:TorF family putative porin [Altericroceibacterium xinjiangense]|uniref:TorF family putative porin n=1 Tax=Altericroceibacterium xinjiangense TaxID=762261 RepID=UPI001F49C3EF|nr:TorF family putative porin [Altericroceibacterium xinjiangense]
MRTSICSLMAATLCFGAAITATPAFAQGTIPGPIVVSGTGTIVSDYRFRGVSQTDEEMAVEVGIMAAHESGAYTGLWASNLSGWGTFRGANVELDLYAGYVLPLGAANLDVGATWYMYPGGADNTDFIEPYVRLSSTLGPVQGLVGVAYAPEQEALGNFSATPYSDGEKGDNLYIWTDVNSGVPNTPVTLKGHVGYSNGNPGLGPNGTSIAPTGEYFDWLVGADYVTGPLTFGVAYVDTDISRAESAYLLPNFANSEDGSSIADAQIVFSVTAGF